MTSKAETRNDKLRAAHDKLQDAVEEIVSGDDWKQEAGFLAACAANGPEGAFLSCPVDGLTPKPWDI